MAPAEIASSGVISRVVTGSFERICAFTSASTVSMSSRVNALGREVKQYLDGFADLRTIDPLPVLDDREHDALAFVARVTGELGRAMLLGEVEPDVLARPAPRALPGRARLGPLLGHGGVKSSAV